MWVFWYPISWVDWVDSFIYTKSTPNCWTFNSFFIWKTISNLLFDQLSLFRQSRDKPWISETRPFIVFSQRKFLMCLDNNATYKICWNFYYYFKASLKTIESINTLFWVMLNKKVPKRFLKMRNFFQNSQNY